MITLAPRLALGAVVVDLLQPPLLVRLRHESVKLGARAQPNGRDYGVDETRGEPDRSVLQATGGPWLNALYGSAELVALLQAATGQLWRPSASHGMYSYYQGGAFLGPHRDIDGCDLTVIVVIQDDRPGGHPLWLWPDRRADPIRAIRAEPLVGLHSVSALPGQAIVILGGEVPHQLPPIAFGHRRIIAPLCFSRAMA